MSLMQLLTILCVSLFGFPDVILSDNIIVRTNYGPVSGKQKYVLGRNVYEFLGIPFAEPPVGDLRFRFPKKPHPWKNILDASAYPPSCIQPLPESYEYSDATSRIWIPPTPLSEDCLYLNIWTRANNNTYDDDSLPMLESSALFGPKGGRPVMVWIHGGSLNRGSASLELYNGAYLASKMDVVVVSIQYRLGPLGFLYLGTEAAPGNQGLMDQVAALEWIRDNIAYFGGNPQQTTLFGHAGGVVCVALHLLSPVSNSLFQQAILQSGSPLAWWAIESPHTALEKSHLLAALSGCKVSDRGDVHLEDLAKCLRSVDASTLEVNQWQVHLLRNGENSSRTMQLKRLYRNRVSHQLITTAGYYFDIPFKPVVTAPLLPKWPYEVLGSGKMDIRHRIMLGVNKDEGMYHLVHSLRMYFRDSEQWPQMPRELSHEAALMDPLDLLAFYIMDENFLHSVLLQATVFEYQIPSRAFGNAKWTAKEVVHALNEVGGDYNIKCPVVEFADFYSRGPNAQVFLFSFEHRTAASSWPPWTGVMQGFEAEYVFGAPFNPDFQKQFYNFTDDERKLSEEIMRFWTNFASTGSPNLNPGEFHTRNKKLYWERYATQGPPTEVGPGENGLLSTTHRKDSSRKHMVFDLPHSYMDRNLRRHHCMFWREQLPQMRERILFNPSCAPHNPGSGHEPHEGMELKNPPGKIGTLYPQGPKKPDSGSATSSSFGSRTNARARVAWTFGAVLLSSPLSTMYLAWFLQYFVSFF